MVRRLYREFQIRYLHRFEAQHLLELAGFRVEELYGDFERSPFDDSSEDMVWVASPVGLREESEDRIDPQRSARIGATMLPPYCARPRRHA